MRLGRLKNFRAPFAASPRWRDLLSAVREVPSFSSNLFLNHIQKDSSLEIVPRASIGLRLIVRAYQISQSDGRCVVWIPDFYCREALEPLRDLNVRFFYYPIHGESLSVSPDFLYQDFGEQKPDIVVVTHFFGRLSSREPWMTFSRRNCAIVVEDFVHCFGLQAHRLKGHFGLFSAHKFYPIKSGACVFWERSRTIPGGTGLISDWMAPAIKEYNDQLVDSSVQTEWVWILKKIAQMGGFKWACPASFDEQGDDVPSMRSLRQELDFFSKRYIACAGNQTDTIHAVRMDNLKLWQGLLTLCLGGRASIDRNADYYLRLLFRGERSARLFYEKSIAHGIPVTTWPDLPCEDIVRDRKHSMASIIRNTSLYLPVHQGITKKHIQVMALSILSDTSATLHVRFLKNSKASKFESFSGEKNLCQSWEYGSAKMKTGLWKALRLEVVNGGGQVLGIAQVLTINFLGIIRIYRLNQGPLTRGWRSQAIAPDFFPVFSAIEEVLPKGIFTFLSVLPAIKDGVDEEILIRGLGYRMLKSKRYKSAVLDLLYSEDELLKQLEGKWRNGLRKSEKKGVRVQRQILDNSHVHRFFNEYAEYQTKKGFVGLPLDLLQGMVEQNSGSWEVSRFTANLDSDSESCELGSLITVEMSCTSIYLASVVSDQGRSLQSNSALLWAAILNAKMRGCKWFDLGGIDDEGTPGVAKFKRGLNGDPYRLLGEWWKIWLFGVGS